MLTEPDWNSGNLHNRHVQLTAISGAAVSDDDSILLEMGMGFSGAECTNDELDAQRAQARKEQTLLLAEGTSTLKKMFVVLGGNEERPIAIANLKSYLLSESKGDADGLQAAREVLQKAADQETNGDLDKLFAIMDVNGDGQISWDEYVHHMQTLYALADAASIHSLAREQQKKAAEAEDPGDDDDDDQDGGDDDEVNYERDDAPEDPDANSEEEESDHNPIASYSVSRVALPLSTNRSQVGSAVDQYDDPVPAPTPATQEDEAERDAKPLRRQEVPSDATKRVMNKSQSPALATRSVRAREIEKEEDANGERDTRRRSTAAKRESAVRKRVATVPSRKPLPTSILDWKVDEVLQWLEEEMELSQYADAIVRNAVNGRLLLTLSEAEIEPELGVTVPLHKRKLMTHIAELQEVVGYPPPQLEPKRTRIVRVNPNPQTTETPAFIRREQLLYQVKHATSQPDETPFNSTKAAKKRPMQTKLVVEQSPALAIASSTNAKAHTRPVSTVQATDRADTGANSEGESFADAMQDILEAVGASTPFKSDAGEAQTEPRTQPPSVSESAVLPKLPFIQIGSITSTDELFEIVKKRIHQLAGQLLPLLSQQDGDTFSDFGDGDDDDNNGDQAADSYASVRDAQQQASDLRLVFNAMASSHAKEVKLSRLRFQESLLSLLAIDASWHQFDLLFRRIDVNSNAELTFDEFQRVFRKEYIGFKEGDLSVFQDALVDFVVDRLDSQEWTLLELFKAFARDGGGKISIAEFGTLVRFLFARTPSRLGRKLDQRGKQPHQTLSNRQIYLLLSCIDVSSDHRIGQQEFLRFFFVVWSTRLMEVQDQLFRLEQSHSSNSGGSGGRLDRPRAERGEAQAATRAAHQLLAPLPRRHALLGRAHAESVHGALEQAAAASRTRNLVGRTASGSGDWRRGTGRAGVAGAERAAAGADGDDEHGGDHHVTSRDLSGQRVAQARAEGQERGAAHQTDPPARARTRQHRAAHARRAHGAGPGGDAQVRPPQGVDSSDLIALLYRHRHINYSTNPRVSMYPIDAIAHTLSMQAIIDGRSAFSAGPAPLHRIPRASNGFQ